ncbi:MAG: UDP-3-O-(3-hydroxymyristoyl)glucosamine N-acyltransferase [Cytophagales bacterium]|nr:UDP-3-O-(3-hydroxymyristoyl)glucosamine N-acyltransferase [Cytophagales bacterium]
MNFTLEQIAKLIDGEVIGDKTTTILNVGKIEEATKGSISFLANPKYENFIYETKASAVIVNHDFEPKKEIETALIRVKDAYSSFTQLLEKQQEIQLSLKVGIEQPSFIDTTTTTPEDIYVGAFAYIGQNCQIGNNVKIYPHVYIGDNTMIEDNTIVYSGVKIYANTIVGKNCVLHAGAIIGSDGFGFAPQEDGSYKTIPQLGNVILEDSVSVGANTTIDCATIGSTVIKKGTKLDNLVQVAHNVEIDEHTVIAAQAGIAGSSKIGKHCQVGGQAGIAGHAKIPNKTLIGAQSGIVTSIKKEGLTVLGSPAIDFKDYIKAYTVFKSLPKMQVQLKKLEEKN